VRYCTEILLYRDTLAIQNGELGLVADILTSLKCNCCNIPAPERPHPENGTEGAGEQDIVWTMSNYENNKTHKT